MSEPWFDVSGAGILGAAIGCSAGLWGAAVGCLSGWLIPKCRGRTPIFALLWLGAAAGIVSLGVAGVALAGGQPYHVWYPLALTGLMLTAMGTVFVFVTRKRYRAAEERRMSRGDFA